MLFNPDGDDSLEKRKMIGGDTTNLFNLTNVKYKWTPVFYRMLMENFWIPEKNDLSVDVKDYLSLDIEIKDVFDNVLSSLVFLDSLQSNNLPKLCDYVTDPSLSLLLTIQSFQEVIHSQAYAYITSIIDVTRMKFFYEKWRKNKVLKQRNSFLVQLYQDFYNNPNNENFFVMLIADYILEGINFYLGFSIFYEITYTLGKLTGTSDIIRLIQRDELTHVVLFQNLINIFCVENSFKIDQQIVKNLFISVVNNEIELFLSFIGNKKSFLSITIEKATEYIQFLCDNRIQDLGFKPLFGVKKNSLQYLSHLSDQLQDIRVKSNFFETNVGKYNMSSAMDDWDKV